MDDDALIPRKMLFFFLKKKRLIFFFPVEGVAVLAQLFVVSLEKIVTVWCDVLIWPYGIISTKNFIYVQRTMHKYSSEYYNSKHFEVILPGLVVM